MNILKGFAFTGVILLASTLASASANAAENSEAWQFGLDFYIWVPGVSGELLAKR